MEDVATNIETLIQKATNPRSHITDTAAVVEICSLLNKESHCAHIATRIIATKIQSSQEWEALQALSLLDTCMKHCGAAFHAEIGKFRFLNEMIKLVSPKYLGGRTPIAVRQRVLQLMHAWTNEYPREVKIKEAYDMLKKQGVVKEDPAYIGNKLDKEKPVAAPPPRPKHSIFEDEERSRLLQKLLQSKNPDDLQAANRLIKTMVKEDEYRVELNSRRVTELESVHNNARLLSEMLDQYRPGQTSAEELELIKELHQSCERLRPNVFRLASETQDNEAMLNEVLAANDELGQVFDKYTAIIVQGKSPAPKNSKPSASLLDLSTPSEEKLPPVPTELLSNQLADLGLDLGSNHTSASSQLSSETKGDNKSNLEALGDIFGSVNPPKPVVPISTTPAKSNSILQPVSFQTATNLKAGSVSPATETQEKPSKLKALEDLDALGESLLKQSLPTSCKVGSQFTKPVTKVPMNLLSKTTATESVVGQSSDSQTSLLLGLGPSGDSGPPSSGLDIDFLIGGSVKTNSSSASPQLLNGSLVNGGGDDSMVDLSEDVAEPVQEVPQPDTISEQNNRIAQALLSVASRQTATPAKTLEANITSAVVNNGGVTSSTVNSPARRVEIKPLNDISVSIESIKPGSIPPLTVIDEKNGISVVLHFAKDSPRPDVCVIVVTTISKNSSPISNYLFQAVVPKDRSKPSKHHYVVIFYLDMFQDVLSSLHQHFPTRVSWEMLMKRRKHVLKHVQTCKMRLQSPSGSDLPAHNPFLPPAAITQVMLIANPNKDPVSLKFMVSYTVDDETITEMGEVERLPIT